MKAAAIVTTLCLGMMAAPCILAQADDRKSTSPEQCSGNHKTIEGVVAGVTVVGETMVDYQSNRAVTAEKDYLTIVSLPRHRHREKGEDQAEHDKQASSGRAKDSARRLASVYLIEVTPKTEICECQDDGKKKSDLAHLEIGDRVEVEYQPFDTAASQSQPQDTRHGRHRIMRGQAVSILILHHKAHHGHDSGSTSQGSKEQGEEEEEQE